LGNFATVGRREVNAGPYAAFKAGDEGGDGGAGRRSNESGIKVFGEAIRIVYHMKEQVHVRI
jgi:hypothetical protein